MFDASAPGFVMAMATIFVDLMQAIAIALAFAALLAVVRLVRREPTRQTATGLLGIALGYFLARSTGDAKDFFLPGILLSAAYGVAFLVSIVIRRPLMGFVAALLDPRYAHWRSHPPLLRAATRATCVWVAFYAIKFFVIGGIYLADRADLLPITRVALGLPMYAATVALTVWLLKPHRQADEPEVVPGDPTGATA